MAEELKNIDNLIAKHLAGETSDTEELLLRDWMDASPENKKYFGDIQFVHEKSVSSHKYHKVDTAGAWEKVRTQMQNRPVLHIQPKVIPMYRRPWVGIAALFVLIIGVSLYFYLQQNTHGTLQPSVAISTTDTLRNEILPDRIHVLLNKNSKLSYAYNPNKKQKEIKLEGEAFIAVTHSQDTALVVTAGETYIRDIGTQFNVKAYPNQATIEVYVTEGEIEFYTTENEGVHLNASEIGIYNKELKTFEKHTADTPNPIAYKTKIFVFRAKQLSQVIEELTEVYPVEIKLSNPKLGKCPITVNFNNEPIEAILDIIAETMGLQVQLSGNEYILSGETCNTP